jgi:glutaredoxin
MNRVCLLPLLRYTGIVVLAVALLCVGPASAAPTKAKASKKTVGIVFFAAHDCPRCESVKDLMKVLKARYPLRVKDFDVDKEADYSLFKRIEAIHAVDKFAVPLVMVGESILMGEDEITGKLEKKVRSLARAGGSPFPYLGSARETKTVAKPDASCRDCEKGRPPEVTDELSKLRKFIEKLF